jgi:hypothetical protein
MFRRFLLPGIIGVVTASARLAAAQGAAGAQLLDGMGSYSHPIRTTSPEAQRYFDQGLALL